MVLAADLRTRLRLGEDRLLLAGLVVFGVALTTLTAAGLVRSADRAAGDPASAVCRASLAPLPGPFLLPLH